MRALIYINLSGLIAGGAYTGFFSTSERFAGFAALATLIYLIALSVPIFSEYMSLGSGFREIEKQQLSSRRRDYTPSPKQEIFGGEVTKPEFKRPNPFFKVILLTALASGFLAYDYWDWSKNPPEIKKDNRTISNF